MKNINEIKADLHCHSNISDGELSPTKLVQRAYERGIELLALTDHDTIDGLIEAEQEAQKLGIKFVTGCEISALWWGKPIHFTALNFDSSHQGFIDLMQRQSDCRLQRAVTIGEKFAKMGIANMFEDAQNIAQGEVTRPHFAQILIERGIVKDQNQAFKKYLAQGKRAYANSSWCKMEEAIEIVHQAGGVICVAHPHRYELTNRKVRLLLEEFKKAGGDGVEVSNSTLSPDKQSLTVKWALEFGLLGSQGSDFHKELPWIDLGKNLHIPKELTPIWHNWGLK